MGNEVDFEAEERTRRWHEVQIVPHAGARAAGNTRSLECEAETNGFWQTRASAEDLAEFQTPTDLGGNARRTQRYAAGLYLFDLVHVEHQDVERVAFLASSLSLVASFSLTQIEILMTCYVILYHLKEGHAFDPLLVPSYQLLLDTSETLYEMSCTAVLSKGEKNLCSQCFQPASLSPYTGFSLLQLRVLK